MTYDELKKAYEEMSEKCSELEKKIEDKNLEIENKNLEIENLTEMRGAGPTAEGNFGIPYLPRTRNARSRMYCPVPFLVYWGIGWRILYT